MKVALACSGLGNIRRGHEVFMENLFQRLKGSDKVKVTLFKGAGETSSQEKVINHIPRNDASLKNLSENEAGEIEQKTFTENLITLLLKEKFDIVYSPDPIIVNELTIKKPGKKLPPVCWAFSGNLPYNLFPQFDYIQQLTSYRFRKGIKMGLERAQSFMIPYGIDLELFDLGQKSSFRKEHGIPQNAFMILSVGAISAGHKRMDWLIEEVASLKDASIYLIICGQKMPDSQNIERLGKELLGERIIFLTLDQKQIVQAYQASDAFALATFYEAFGLVYLEAMAMSLPIIATNHPNQRCIIGNTGNLVNVMQKGEIAQAIKKLKENEPERKRLGKKARKRVEELYAWENLVPHYEKMFETMCERNGKKLG